MILRYVFQPKSVHYKYRFQCPDSSNYDPAFYELQLESLESFAWNLVDNVVGNHGTGDHKLSDVCIALNNFLFKKKNLYLVNEILAYTSCSYACFKRLYNKKY